MFLHLGLTDIFRPFVGYKEVRLVSKESRHVSLFILVIIINTIIIIDFHCFSICWDNVIAHQ